MEKSGAAFTILPKKTGACRVAERSGRLSLVLEKKKTGRKRDLGLPYLAYKKGQSFTGGKEAAA